MSKENPLDEMDMIYTTPLYHEEREGIDLPLDLSSPRQIKESLIAEGRKYGYEGAELERFVERKVKELDIRPAETEFWRGHMKDDTDLLLVEYLESKRMGEYIKDGKTEILYRWDGEQGIWSTTDEDGNVLTPELLKKQVCEILKALYEEAKADNRANFRDKEKCLKYLNKVNGVRMAPAFAKMVCEGFRTVQTNNISDYEIPCKSFIWNLKTSDSRPYTKNTYITARMNFDVIPEDIDDIDELCRTDKDYKAIKDYFYSLIKGNDFSQEEQDEYVLFLRGLSALCLSNLTTKRFYALIGRGNSGKSTFVDILNNCANGYCTTLADSALQKGYSSNQQTDARADLYGKTMAICPELSAKVVDVEFLKRITGGDMVSARYLRKSHFTFKNKATLIIHSNQEVTYGLGVDRALIERIVNVPFENQFAPGSNPFVNRLLANDKDVLNKFATYCLASLKGVGEPGFDVPVPARNAKIVEESVNDDNPYYRYVKDCFVYDEKAPWKDFVSVDEAWKYFSAYCYTELGISENNNATSKGIFRGAMQRAIGTLYNFKVGQITVPYRGRKVYRGFILRKVDEESR